MNEIPTDERSLLDAVLANPDDDGLRLAYADWLEEHGDERAEWLRSEVGLMRTDDSRRDARLRNTLAVLAQSVDWSWRLAVSRVPVLNCQRGSDSNRACGRRWVELDATDMTSPSDRFCNDCEQVVRFVRSLRTQHRRDRPFCLDEVVQDPAFKLEYHFRYRCR